MAEHEVIHGDKWTKRGTVYDADDELYEFTGKTVRFTVKPRNDHRDDDANALVQLIWTDGGAVDGISISDPLSGVLSITMTPAQTNLLQVGDDRYRYDVQVVGPGSDDVDTPDMGTITVIRDTTRTATL